MSEQPMLYWLDGELMTGRTEPDPAAPPDPAGALPCCYTTARVRDGQVRHESHHVRRLQRDARAVGLGEVDGREITRAFHETARAAFPGAECIVRVEAFRAQTSRVHLRATPREVGEEPATWSAIVTPIPHPGPDDWSGAKLLGRECYERARELSDRAGVDEALMIDGKDRLVEGARCNIIVLDSGGVLSTPDRALGGVAGVAREILLDEIEELVCKNQSLEDLRQAREIIAVNAVRGACPIVALDGKPVADGRPGPWAARLDSILSGSS
jgi:branched-subunit amino acid aminotransferase/4-amino-4-deoxychorismate lyase